MAVTLRCVVRNSGEQLSAVSPDGSDAIDTIVDQWADQVPDLDVSAMQVLGRLHRSYLKYQSALNVLFERQGINTASFDVMAALRRSGPPYRMTAGQLSVASMVTTGGITMRLDRLEKAGLVARERDASDRRIVHAQLTDKGFTLVEETARAHFANEARMLSQLNDAERSQLAVLLRKLEHSIDENPVDDASPALSPAH